MTYSTENLIHVSGFKAGFAHTPGWQMCGHSHITVAAARKCGRRVRADVMAVLSDGRVVPADQLPIDPHSGLRPTVAGTIVR